MGMRRATIDASKETSLSAMYKYQREYDSHLTGTHSLAELSLVEDESRPQPKIQPNNNK
jgi:hypothetical protein